jgi:hypothetical protein
MEQQIEEIQQRLARAEAEVQRLRTRSRQSRWLLLALVVASVFYVGTRPTATQAQFLNGRPPWTLQAPFIVVDGHGKPILQILANAQGRGLVLFDESGRTLCGIGTTPQNRGLAVFDAQEKMVAGLGVGRTPDAVATGRGLTVLDEAQKIVGTLGTGTNGSNMGRGVSVNDETGKQVVGLGVWPQRPDRGQLVLSDRNNSIFFAQPALP